MVIDVFISPCGMPSSSVRMWPRWATGTPTLPTSPRASGIVGVVAGLGGQVEGDRQAGLTLGQVGPVQLVGRLGRRVAGVGPHQPRAIPLPGHGSLGHGPIRRRLGSRFCTPSRLVAASARTRDDPPEGVAGRRARQRRGGARATRRQHLESAGGDAFGGRLRVPHSIAPAVLPVGAIPPAVRSIAPTGLAT